MMPCGTALRGSRPHPTMRRAMVPGDQAESLTQHSLRPGPGARHSVFRWYETNWKPHGHSKCRPWLLFRCTQRQSGHRPRQGPSPSFGLSHPRWSSASPNAHAHASRTLAGCSDVAVHAGHHWLRRGLAGIRETIRNEDRGWTGAALRPPLAPLRLALPSLSYRPTAAAARPGITVPHHPSPAHGSAAARAPVAAAAATMRAPTMMPR